MSPVTKSPVLYGRMARIIFASLLGVALTGTQALAAVSTACQPKANHSCCCPKQQAVPACHMGCTDQHAPEAMSAAGTAQALTVPAPQAIAAAWLQDAADLDDANASFALARCPFHPPTLKRYLLDRTLRL